MPTNDAETPCPKSAKQLGQIMQDIGTRPSDDGWADGDVGMNLAGRYRPWEEIDENQKDLNRFAADHIPVKIRAVGFELNDPDLARKWSELDVATLTELSRAEHNRWAAQLYMAGWQYSAVRDDENRLHPDLCDFEDLDQPTKDYDLQMVRRAAHFWTASRSGG